MKQFLSRLSILLLTLFVFDTQAQVIDTAEMGAGYANSIYYSFSAGTKIPHPVKNWDLAFRAGVMTDGIFINSSNGVELFMVQNTDTSGWLTLDTANYASWPKYYNSDTTWEKGAFNISDPSDIYSSWGEYNMTTHVLTGDSLYLMKLTTGSNTVYKKVWMVKKDYGSYTFRYANLDNSSDTTVVLDSGSAIFDKTNFGYYSIRDNQVLINEPRNDRWDIVFTRYWAEIAGGPTPFYQVTGVLSNIGVKVSEARGIDPKDAYQYDFRDGYKSNISVIGHDWKTPPAGGPPATWTVDTMLCFFVKTVSGNIWKIQPLSFDGAANGRTIFVKTDFVTSINEDPSNPVGSMAVYPNPASQSVNVLLSARISGNAVVNIYDMAGRVQLTKTISVNPNDLLQEELNVQGFTPGLYIVSVVADGFSTQQKLMIR